MADFTRFDRRRYPVVGVRDGYREWRPTYEETVFDGMDIALLERLADVAAPTVSTAADLGCGTGRIGVWLRNRCIAAIDGVDLTPEMLVAARHRSVYRRLIAGDLRDALLPAASYDLVTCSLVDEHLPSLTKLYAQAARLLTPSGRFTLVSYHPYFLMAVGMPTHYRRADGSDATIETHLHLLGDHVEAARSAGLGLAELHEALIDDAWLERKPKWRDYAGWPISACTVWQRG